VAAGPRRFRLLVLELLVGGAQPVTQEPAEPVPAARQQHGRQPQVDDGHDEQLAARGMAVRCSICPP
jgi:hypothetical protein